MTVIGSSNSSARPNAAPLDGRHAIDARQIASVVLLAGSVRSNTLFAASGRSLVDLPVTASRTVLDFWLDHLSTLAHELGIEQLPVRVMVDRSSPTGSRARGPENLRLTVEQDPSEFRGTGGLLHDLAQHYEDDQYILVAHGSNLLFEPLFGTVSKMLADRHDVVIGCLKDGSPIGLQLIRCGAVRRLNGVGYIDFNEQALPTIAKDCSVYVARVPRPLGRSVRTLSNYIHTLRGFHNKLAGRIETAPKWQERWQASFSLIEPGTVVHEKSVIHDSVVLGGARIESDSVVVRSVVCPGTVVGRGESVIDTITGISSEAMGTRW